jgi:hypothetical protein
MMVSVSEDYTVTNNEMISESGVGEHVEDGVMIQFGVMSECVTSTPVTCNIVESLYETQKVQVTLPNNMHIFDLILK